jgi:hypothetical protein
MVSMVPLCGGTLRLLCRKVAVTWDVLLLKRLASGNELARMLDWDGLSVFEA